ncbi:DMT family transporter [Cellulomonas soli]|uniref:Transporter n=1 Tax=Cellulomonas soli TaxID=931535 RepID=A0A512P8L3_9CELL|nr:DMT family transporter [Cellulomonas soli]NYI57753.1 drug/metabolite transporter (DMT)-like permease [Cellulomonas soli]GEP67537.1 transporter [Cellulomonas soli]
MDTQPDRRTAAMYITLAAVWGSSFLLIKVALHGLSPAQLVLGRLVLGAVSLIALMLLTRRRWPRGLATWGHLLVVALVLCVMPFLLFSWAGQYLPSGLSSIYNASTPIMTAVAAGALLPGERLDGRQRLGIAVGALGVVVIVGPWSYLGEPALTGSLPAQLACLGATACYGLGITWMRRFVQGRGHDAVTVAASQITLAAVLMLALAPFLGGFAPVDLTGPVVASTVVLGALGTGLAYVWNTRVIERWGAQRASTVTYLTPVVGVLLGVLVLDERLQWNEPVGGLLVVLGILVAQRVLGRPRPATSPVAPTTADVVHTAPAEGDLDEVRA